MPGFELIGQEELDAIKEVFDKGGILHRYGFEALRNGTYKVTEFEQAVANKLGVRYAHAVTSGSVALKVALKALGIGPGDEVITQSFTFVATVEAIIEVGAEPVITEIDSTFNMDPSDLEALITPSTKAIIPVHMLGVGCDMDAIMNIAKQHKLPVLEDACEAFGATYHNQALGTIGTIGAFSFDFGKTITTGEGGMIVTNDEDLYRRAREYADHGHEQNPNFPRGKDTRQRGGFNYRMMELQGAYGLAQLKKLTPAIAKQRQSKARLKNMIKDVPGITFRQLSDQDGEAGDTLIFFFGKAFQAEQFVRAWQAKGFGTKNVPDAIDWHYAGTWDQLLPQYPRYQGKPLSEFWPHATDLLSRSVALPIMLKFDDTKLTTLAAAVHEIIRSL